MIDTYNIIEKQFSNLKNINNQNEYIYSNIKISILQYNEIINEEYNISFEQYLLQNDIIENNIKNIVEHAKYQELENIGKTLNIYNINLNSNIDLIRIKTQEIEDNIVDFNIFIDTEISKYNIQKFKILLNIFIQKFKVLTYNEKIQKLSILKLQYLKYLKSVNKINKAVIISHLHPIYITPLLLNNISETIILKDNIIDLREINTYYGILAPYNIQFNIKLLTSNIRNNLFEVTKPLFKSHEGILYFYPDYRNKTYELEIEAYSILVSKMKYKFIIVENSFPEIKPITFIESNIRLGKINNNTFNLNLQNYYNDSNILFMVESHNKLSKTLSNLTYDDIYTYTTTYINYCNIPTITDNIIITPYKIGYPIIYEEYSNIPVVLNIISSPEITIDKYHIDLNDRTPYIYDLTQINEWYINVTHESIVSFNFLKNSRSNLKNPTLPIIMKDPFSNLLYIYPDYRGETYNINISIESINDYALKNIIELKISENNVPKPTRTIKNLLLQHLLIKDRLVFDANKYFSSITNELLIFDYNVSNIIDRVNNVKLNSLSYNIFEITDSNLIFNPDYRNISYDLYVYATDSIYNIRSDMNLILNVREDRVLNKKNEIFNLLNIGNDKIDIDIYNHIKLPINQELRYKNGLTYSVLIDKDLRKSKIINNEIFTLSDGILSIYPDFRNDNYSVTVFVEAYETIKVDKTSFRFLVSEVIAPYPIITNDNILIENSVINTKYCNITKTLYINSLTNENRLINLDLFFINNINYSKNKYSIISNTEESKYYIINDNNLIITPDFRNISYKFSILATDNLYNTYKLENNLLNIEGIELHPIKLKENTNIRKYELTDNEININLDDIFMPVIGTDILKYYVFIESMENEIRLNISNFKTAYIIDNNILKLYPDYRGIKYKLNITAINFNYITQPLTYYIDITENNKLLPTPIIDANNFEINVAYLFNYMEGNLRINLEKLFTHYKYYPNYVIRLSSTILKLEDFINIRLGYLVISKFVFTFNFAINIFLFDIVENKKVNNDEITINFRNNIQRLRFIGFNTKINIELEQITSKFRYNIIGLNGVILDSSKVELIKNNIIITKSDTLQSYDFVVNKVHIELNLIVKQIIYKVDNNLV
jgi:hypothetical protein